MDNAKAAVVGGAAVVIIIGAVAVQKLDTWFSPEATGPGSGDELPDDYQGNVEYNDGKDRGNGPGEPGPGSGDELPDDYQAYNDGKDRGNGVNEPGPGSGDELPDDYQAYNDGKDRGNGINQPGPGSGDELPDEPDMQAGELVKKFISAGSCNLIDSGSTCVDYTGSYWQTIEYVMFNCSEDGFLSGQPCPQPVQGGCVNGIGGEYEMIVWHYNYGGDPFDAETTGYAAQACASVGQTWIGQ